MIKTILKEFPMILPLLACLSLVGASSAPLAVSSLPYGNEPLPQCVTYNDDDTVITFTLEETSYVFTNLAAIIFETLPTLTGSEIRYNSLFYSYSETDYEYLDYSNGSSVIEFRSDGSWVIGTSGTDNWSALSYGFEWDLSGNSAYATYKTAIQADIAANQSGMSGVEVVNEIVDILAGGLTSLGSSIGAGVATFAQSLAFDGDGLSIYFILVVVFAGVALAVGLTTLIFRWLTNLGN